MSQEFTVNYNVCVHPWEKKTLIYNIFFTELVKQVKYKISIYIKKEYRSVHGKKIVGLRQNILPRFFPYLFS